ncbi:glycosyl transferase family protein [Tolypothrix tenuis PCC 7101]|uniref:Glycosyl transferase family protein n=1 Tax=Tolypothrix tenuis PCC 7101 TaxID=231146 RepID=A0A1Z4N7L2_9CYAN|nr:glycosyltransferase family 2 protein [Aulosira sp. FACHB-113]BAZ01694.1 glycosyl transferase family protein [Tolypothrix tenuis PCC 7101]BAZ74381.1 glycosyl transferase family protein [Aulosira laxa NIES-50]
MKFSVVISTYNRLDLLKRAINSALNQTIPCEVVVADDCSADETEVYVKSLGNSVIYHRNEVNKGHAATVNAGVTKASGDWIKFLDDDDYLAPNCIEEMAKAISLHSSAVICSCIGSQVDSNEQELSRTPKVGPGLAFYIPQADIHYGMLLELVPFGTPVQVACCRDTFLKTGGWNPQLDANCDDIDSWISIAQFGDAIFLNQCLAYRTIWTGAYNQKFSLLKRLDTNILMKEKIYALVDHKHSSYLPSLKNTRNYVKLHWLLVALKRRQLTELLKMIDGGILSPIAWWVLVTATLSRRLNYRNSHLNKFVLIDDREANNVSKVWEHGKA